MKASRLVLLLASLTFASPHLLRAQSVAGEWKLDFHLVSRSADPQAKPAPWISFTATVVQVDSGVGGAMRSSGPSGQFGCKWHDGACTNGHMRLSWDEHDWQVFEFQLAAGAPGSGTGRAEIHFSDGATDRYTFTMAKLGPGNTLRE